MFRTLNNFIFTDKRVLLRLDIDVPLNENREIEDDYRLLKALPTLKYLEENGTKQIIIIGHVGRPKGKVVDSLKVNPIANKLSKLLNHEILKLDDCINIEIPISSKFVMLENLRFHIEERNNDENFAKKLASLADIFVLESFANSHRDHASITGVQKFLPSCAGLQLTKEIDNLNITNANKPIIALLGAAKIADKINLINKLLKKVDKLLLGGGAIFTFFKATGDDVGKSLVDNEHLNLAKELLANPKIILPDDIVCANEISENAKTVIVSPHEIPHTYIGLDIGKKTIEKYKNILKDAKTIIWNGPMGMFEIDKFAAGTKEIANYIATLDAKSIIGGGDTASAIRHLGLENKFSHVSTGGGAALKLLEGETLAGIKALEENIIKFD